MSNDRDNVFEFVQLKPKPYDNAKESTSIPRYQKDVYQDLTVNTLSRKNNYENAKPKTDPVYEDVKNSTTADTVVESTRKLANKDNISYFQLKTAVAAVSLVMGAVFVVSLVIFITPLSIFNYETYRAHASYSTEEFQQMSKKLDDLNKSLIMINELHEQLSHKLDLSNKMIRSEVSAEVSKIYSNVSQVNVTVRRNISTLVKELQNIVISQDNVINRLRMEAASNITNLKRELKSNIASVSYVANTARSIANSASSTANTASSTANTASRRIGYISSRNVSTGCRLRRSSVYTWSSNHNSPNLSVSYYPSTSVSHNIR